MKNLYLLAIATTTLTLNGCGKDHTLRSHLHDGVKVMEFHPTASGQLANDEIVLRFSLERNAVTNQVLCDAKVGYEIVVYEISRDVLEFKSVSYLSNGDKLECSDGNETLTTTDNPNLGGFAHSPGKTYRITFTRADGTKVSTETKFEESEAIAVTYPQPKTAFTKGQSLAVSWSDGPQDSIFLKIQASGCPERNDPPAVSNGQYTFSGDETGCPLERGPKDAYIKIARKARELPLPTGFRGQSLVIESAIIPIILTD
ncbi:MAG: hypothetical protein JST16_00900 [Bdellovibrionales bacterium]|nr:hypothetical protein [Bdellovibrionales bacterium]